MPENDHKNDRANDAPPEVIEYVPKRRPIYNFNIIAGLILAWIVVLVAAFFLKSRLIQMVWPVIFLVLLIYLIACTVIAMRRK